jgi:hypothetical protein
VPTLTDISLHGVRRSAVLFGALLISVGVCLPPVQAQSTGPAKLIQMTGQVSVLKFGSPWALNNNDVVQPQQVVITGPDGAAIFQMLDGSTVEVFPNSRFVFHEASGDWEELLRLYLGKVRVHIQKLGGRPNHNKVRTETAVISVRGTIFDVDVRDDEGTTMVLVEEGSVDVKHQLQPGPPKILNEGEWVEVFWNQPLATIRPDHTVFVKYVANMVKDAAYEALIHNRAGVGVPTTTGTSSGGTGADRNGTGGSSGGGSAGSAGGSTGSGAPPPPPPAPPAPH